MSIESFVAGLILGCLIGMLIGPYYQSWTTERHTKGDDHEVS